MADLTPIERAARALAEGLDCTARMGEQIDTIDDLRNAELDIGRVDLLDVARAVLLAIREPSPRMITSGYIVSEHMAFIDDGAVRDEMNRIWQAMIDAALSGQPAPAPMI